MVKSGPEEREFDIVTIGADAANRAVHELERLRWRRVEDHAASLEDVLIENRVENTGHDETP